MMRQSKRMVFCKLLTFLLSTVFLFTVHANDRFRLSDNPTASYQTQHDDYILYVSPGSQAGAMRVMLIPDWRTDTGRLPNFMFSGICAPAGKIHIGITQVDTPAIQAFAQQPNLEDFPYKQKLDILRKELNFQCPDMNQVTVIFGGEHQYNRLKQWQGYLNAGNDWMLSAQPSSLATDESISLSFRAHNPSLRTQPIGFNIGTEYKGPCKDIMEITLSVYPSSNNAQGIPSIADYEWVSGNVTSQVLQFCPATKEISYKMDPVAKDYNCPDQCEVYASVASNWSFESGHVYDFTRRPPETYAADFQEMIDALTTEDSEKIAGGPLLPAFYHGYLSHYSNLCGTHIKDPVPFKYKTTTSTTDEYGFETGRYEEISETTTFVERAYADRFKRFFANRKIRGMQNFFAAALKAKNRSQPLNLAILTQSVLQDDYAIIRHLRKGCTSDEVTMAYSKLYEVSHSKSK